MALKVGDFVSHAVYPTLRGEIVEIAHPYAYVLAEDSCPPMSPSDYTYHDFLEQWYLVQAAELPVDPDPCLCPTSVLAATGHSQQCSWHDRWNNNNRPYRRSM